MNFISWLEPALDSLEKEYRQHFFKQDVRVSMIGIAVCALVWIILAYNDFLFFGFSRQYWLLTLCRIIFLSHSIVLLFVFRKLENIAAYEWLTLTFVIFGSLLLFYINTTRPPSFQMNISLEALAIFGIYLVFPNKLLFRILPAFVFSISTVLTTIFYRSLPTPSMLTMTLSVVGANVAGIIISVRWVKTRKGWFKATIDSKRAEEELRESEVRYRELAELLPTFVYEVDNNLLFTFVNRAGLEVSGYIMEDIQAGVCALDVIHPDEHERLLQDARKVLSGENVGGHEYTLIKKDGTTIPTISYSCPITRDGKVVGIRGVGIDLTERKLVEVEREELIRELTTAREALSIQANRDGLTHLWNRSAILNILQKELNRANRERTPIGVIIADADNFKQINDQFGHLIGDEALCEVANRMLSMVRPYDSIGRYGGEEFIIVTPGCDLEKARRLADRLCSNFREVPVETSVGSLNLTMSFGVMGLEGQNRTDTDHIIRAADQALYRAKRLGKKRVEVWCTNGSEQ